MVSTNDITINVSYRGSTYPISVPPSSLLADLQASIEDLTGVPVSHQKLLYKGKKTSRRPTSEDEEERTETVEGAGLKDGLKVMLVGGTKEEVGTVQREEQKAKQRETIERERRAKPQAKLRSTGRSSTSSEQYTFHAIRPHPQFPSPEALNVLRRLADDPAIRHVMQTHRFAVGVLTEFAPHEHPDKLGYNTNAGQSISLRIRTDLYDGFRPYLDVRKVLLHELTHNVWGDHDNNFKELNSQLNREVLEYERTLKANTHTLSETDPAFSSVYDSSSDLREATSFVLGGPGTGMPASRDEGVAERRRRVLEATMARLRKEEEELEGACGTDAAQSSSTGTLFGRAVLPRGIKVGIDVKRIFPDVLVFDGEVSGSEDDQEETGRAFSYGWYIPHPRISLIFHCLHYPLYQASHTPLCHHFHAPAHIRPDDWLPAISIPVERDDDEGTAVEVEAKIVDVPLQVLEGREKEFRNFVGKVIFSSGGALAGVQGTAAVGVRIDGLPFKHGEGGEMELTGLPFEGSVRVGKKSTF